MIELKINNGGIIRILQEQADGNISVHVLYPDMTQCTAFVIKPNQMVMLLNWFQYQMERGNSALVYGED